MIRFRVIWSTFHIFIDKSRIVYVLYIYVLCFSVARPTASPSVVRPLTSISRDPDLFT